jgi:hypothetical protein
VIAGQQQILSVAAARQMCFQQHIFHLNKGANINEQEKQPAT